MESGRPNINLFETSLPVRLDYEAMLAYLLLPPAGGVFLLVVEHKSDYVRYVKLRDGGVIGTLLLWGGLASENLLHAAAPLLSVFFIHCSLCIDRRLSWLPHAYTDKTICRFHAWQSSLLFAAIFVSPILHLFA